MRDVNNFTKLSISFFASFCSLFYIGNSYAQFDGVIRSMQNAGRVINQASSIVDDVKKFIPAKNQNVSSENIQNASSSSKEINYAQIKTVVVDGYGKEVADAAQNAAANALVQVAGSVIDYNKQLTKKVDIENGLRNEARQIKVDIKEYSQGSIEKFEILKVENSSPIKVVAKVSVRSEKLKIYIDEITKSNVDVDEGLFATVKTDAKNSQGAAGLLFEKIIQPSIAGDAIEFFISKPISASKLNLSQIYTNNESIILAKDRINKFERANEGVNVIGLIISTNLKSSFYDSAKNLLEKISSKNVNSYHKLSNSDIDFNKDVVLMLDQTGSVYAESIDSKFYLISGVKSELCKISKCKRNIIPTDDLSLKRMSLNYKSLQIEVKDASERVVFIDSVEPTKYGASKSNKMYVVEYAFRSAEEQFPYEWAHVAVENIGSPGEKILIRKMAKFLVLIGLSDDQMRYAKSINVLLN